MNKFISALKDKRFRYGTLSTVMMLVAVIIFVLVNLLATEFNRTRDLTSDGIFTLTRQSREFLATLDTDVTITSIAETGAEHPALTALLDEYAQNRHITVQHRDPLLNPAMIHAFAARAGLDAGIPSGSVIVESGNNIRVLTQAEMLPRDTNWFTGQTTIRSFSFEAEITRAIHAVTLGDPTVMYYVTGSGEVQMPPALASFLESENIILREINLVLEDVPAYADILFIPMPARDWTEVKASRIRDFLSDEGLAFFAFDFSITPTPNMDSVLAEYGIAVGDYLILEGDQRRIFQNLPYNILPTATDHPMLDTLRDRDLPNMVFFPTNIEVLPVRRATTEIDPIWVTSNSAFARRDFEDGTLNQIPGDLDGPFYLAVAVTDRFFTTRTHETRFVAVSNLAIMDPSINMFMAGGNFTFILNAILWLEGAPPSIWIPSRLPPGTSPLIMTQASQNMMTGIAIGVIPVTTIIIGVFIWFKRKNA